MNTPSRFLAFLTISATLLILFAAIGHAGRITRAIPTTATMTASVSDQTKRTQRVQTVHITLGNPKDSKTSDGQTAPIVSQNDNHCNGSACSVQYFSKEDRNTAEINLPAMPRIAKSVNSNAIEPVSVKLSNIPPQVSTQQNVQPNTQTASPAQNEPKRYTLLQNDTLYRIAQVHYGDASQWSKIVQANPGLDPARLRVGQEIILPPIR